MLGYKPRPWYQRALSEVAEWPRDLYRLFGGMMGKSVAELDAEEAGQEFEK